MLKSCVLMQCGNWFILSMASLLWPALCQRGLDWEATSFLNWCASHCQGHCLSFSVSSFSVCHPFVFLPLKAACRALADESDYLIWRRLNEMCVYVCVRPPMREPDFHALSTLESLSDLWHIYRQREEQISRGRQQEG